MPSMTKPKPTYGQVWTWTGYGYRNLYFLIAPQVGRNPNGVWAVCTIGGSAGRVMSMSGLYIDQPVLDEWEYVG